MGRNAAIGLKIKQLRTGLKYTLKQVSDETGLSVGFLSQLERGLSSIAIDSLSKIADVLGVTLTSFFDEEDEPAQTKDPVVHSFDMHQRQISHQIIQYTLSKNVRGFDMLPRIYQLMPYAKSDDVLEMYSHTGEEFIYVLEGIVTVYVGEERYTLYPGDSMQIHSTDSHNWTNRTNKVAKLMSLNYPNPFITNEPDHNTKTGS